jgi:hypothetical protein|tara:strand:+ start:1198 stop:1866 length:669 start_codon:yes stop_codon:yes gene_type:complete
MICAQCNKEFTPIHWSQKYCSKECLQIHKKEYQKKYRQLDSYKDYQKNYGQSERGKGVTKKSREKNKEKIKIDRLRYQRSDKGQQTSQNYYQSNKTKINTKNNIYINKRKKVDPIFKLKGNLRGRLNGFLKIKNLRKTNKTFKMVGCTPEFLKKHLEKQFHRHPDYFHPMNWHNYTLHGWHIDHIIPLDSAKTPEDVEKLMHYTNLQPMWATYNIKKGNKII